MWIGGIIFEKSLTKIVKCLKNILYSFVHLFKFFDNEIRKGMNSKFSAMQSILQRLKIY